MANNRMIYARNKKVNPKNLTCAKCGKKLTLKTAYYYVDGCNYGITNSAKPHCKECYIEKYGRY